MRFFILQFYCKVILLSAGTDREEKKLNSVIIGQRIKDARKSMNLTQKELGYLIYADGKYISRLENGGSLPSLKRLVLLSRVLNRTCDYFIWDIDVMEEDVTPREEIVIRDEQERKLLQLWREIC
ncbi:MAG: XRE family transcriptional regulator [Coprococcus eutactus]|nr:XRE family transcriptional regulator [Coprococcus eutactus]